MNKCPYCGSEKGVFTTFIGTQYYKWNGEADGYSDSMDNESKFAKCIECGRKISMNRILKEREINSQTEL